MKTLAILLLSSLLSVAGDIKIAWDRPTPEELLADKIGGYRVHYGTESGVYTTSVDVGLVWASTLTGLTDGTIYFSALTAYNTFGLESPFSNEISFRPLPTPPPAPTGFRVVIEQSYNLRDWQPIASIDLSADSPAAFYRARISPTTNQK
jgi:hypothetical protein